MKDERHQVGERPAAPASIEDDGGALLGLVEALRTTIAAILVAEAPAEELAAARVALDRLNERLATSERRRQRRIHPMTGAYNAVAPPIRMWRDGDCIRASCTFNIAYEGPIGSVHGGFIAAAFDSVLGHTVRKSGRTGMTGSLNVQYRRPTPLDRELMFESRIETMHGRKTIARATLHADGVLCAEAEGLFVAPRSTGLGGLKKP